LQFLGYLSQKEDEELVGVMLEDRLKPLMNEFIKLERMDVS
jgi:hypothetical protein